MTIFNNDDFDIAIDIIDKMLEPWDMQDFFEESKRLVYDIKCSAQTIEYLKEWIFEISIKAINLIKKDFFDISIEIKEKDPEKKISITNDYKQIVKLYLKEEYAEAIRRCRDVFQNDLEANLNSDMKIFENSNIEIEKEFNNILKSITNIRNIVKTESPNIELQAIAKVIIEQLLSIRNYLAIKE